MSDPKPMTEEWERANAEDRMVKRLEIDKLRSIIRARDAEIAKLREELLRRARALQEADPSCTDTAYAVRKHQLEMDAARARDMEERDRRLSADLAEARAEAERLRPLVDQWFDYGKAQHKAAHAALAAQRKAEDALRRIEDIASERIADMPSADPLPLLRECEGIAAEALAAGKEATP